MIQKIKSKMGIVIGSTIGAWLGSVLWRWIDYCRHEGLYRLASAPWYAGLIPLTVMTGILLLIETALYLFLRYRVKKSGKGE